MKAWKDLVHPIWARRLLRNLALPAQMGRCPSCLRPWGADSITSGGVTNTHAVGMHRFVWDDETGADAGVLCERCWRLSSRARRWDWMQLPIRMWDEINEENGQPPTSPEKLAKIRAAVAAGR